MAKKPRRKASLHSAGKVTEAELLARARALADDPTPAMPICEGGCVLFSPVVAARKAILRIHAQRDDEAALTKATSRGNELAKAYAATLLLARSERIPYVADLKIMGEAVPYVMRGTAKPFFLAGLQNHHDRAHRLLAVMPWVRKRRLHFFSADRGIVCTGRRASPPEDFVREEAEDLGLARREPGVYACEHGGACEGHDALIIHWRAAGERLERCEDCLDEGSTLGSLLRHMAGPKLLSQFDVEVRLRPLHTRAGAPLPAETSLPAEARTAYLAARLSDQGLLAAARQARVASLRTAGRRIYVAGDTSYGEDVEAFVAALQPNATEERALRAGLAAHEGSLVIDRATLARALHGLWPQQGRRMLEAVSDAATADSLYREKPAPEEVVELVRRAGREGSARAELARLPTYATLPPAADAAHAIARAFRTQGPEAAVRAAQERASLPKAKGVVLGFLLALGGAKGQEWRFSDGDREVASALAPVVERLLRGDAAGYHEALVEASLRSGETASFAPRQG